MDNRYRKQRHDSESEAEKARYLIEESFREDKSGANAPKAFIKGGVIDPTSKMSKDSNKGDVYVPGANRGRDERKILSAFEQAEANRPAPPPQSYTSTSKSRNIDKVAQEMKARRQAEMSQKAKQPEKPSQREPPREPAKFKGSNFSDVLPKPKEVSKDKEYMETTEETASIFGSLTNYHTHTFADQSNASLVITNLPYNVQEGEIKQVLSSYGEIEKFLLSGLKPNQDQPPRLVAFVKYKKEADAQAAREILKTTGIKGVAVTARWGQAASTVKSIKDGHIIEQAIMERERDSKEFSFLYVKGSDEHNYYRWRVFAFANGDNDKEWRLEPFRIYEGGPLWYPPPNLDADEKTKKKTAVGSLRLSEEKREQFEDMLRNLTTDRKSICEAMAFCMDHAEHSAEVVFIITEAIKNAETPVQKKMARLYLINDILYNSSLLQVQAAWSYRTFFEPKLPEIFEHLNKIPDTSSDMVKDKIMKVLKLWNDWAIYDLKYLLGLEATFKRKANLFGSSQGSLREGEKTNFVKETSEIGLKLRFIEEKLNEESTKELEKTCRLNGLLIGGGRRDLIERILILRDYELRNNKDDKTDLGIQFETVEKRKIDITTDLIKDYNKLLSVKQPPNLGLHEIEKMISGGLELLKFLQTRNEKIDEKDINGEPLDELDFALYDLPQDNDFNFENLTEADIPASVNLDGEPLTDAELRELERMERKQSYPQEPIISKERKDSKDLRSPKRRREKSKSRDRSKERSSRYSRDKKYSKRRSSSSSSSSSRSRSRSSSSSSRSSRSSSRSRSDSKKRSKKVQRKR